MATPVEDKLVAPPEYIHEAPIPTTGDAANLLI